MRAARIVDGKPVISEKVFQAQVKKAALLTGWMYYATWNSIHSPAGFPDCVLVHPKKKRIIFCELKSEKGKLSEKQREWINALCQIAHPPELDVCVIRPADFDDFYSLLSR